MESVEMRGQEYQRGHPRLGPHHARCGGLLLRRHQRRAQECTRFWSLHIRFICNLLIDLGDGILWLLMLLPRAILFLWDCLLDFVVHSIVAHGLSLLNSAFRASIGLALLLVLYMFRRYVYLMLIYLLQRGRIEISTKTQSVYLWTHHKLQHFIHNVWYVSENTGSASPERCVVCMAQSRNVVVMPCRHLCLCKECSLQLVLLLEDRCPVCRHNITSFLSVYV